MNKELLKSVERDIYNISDRLDDVSQEERIRVMMTLVLDLVGYTEQSPDEIIWCKIYTVLSEELARIVPPQPVFVIHKEILKAIIEKQARFNTTGWGTTTPETLLVTINDLKKDDKGFIKVSRAMQCVNAFKSSKLIYSNTSLEYIRHAVKYYRKIEGGLTCELCSWYGNDNPKLATENGRFCEEHAKNPTTLV